MRRRDFIKATAATSVLPLCGAIASPGGIGLGDGVRPSRLYKAVYDERYEAAVAFGAAAHRLGVPARSIDGDVTALWVDDLSLRWRAEPAVVAGITSAEALFCLEQLAWDRGRRVVVRAGHETGPDGRRTAILRGPAALLAQLEVPNVVSPEWGILFARAVTRHWDASPVAAATGRTQRNAGMVSWVIAPRA